jgi:hypothetical protein
LKPNPATTCVAVVPSATTSIGALAFVDWSPDPNVATAMFVVGGVLAGTSIVVGVTAPSRVESRAAVRLSPGGISFAVAF